MDNVFDSPDMASGYAAARPPVHPRIIERVQQRLRLGAMVPRALDVGCGAGLSSAPLLGLARRVIGIDPSPRMLRLAAATAPGARFVNATAEMLPVASHSIDLMTAAGSLNWVDLDRFWLEARRALAATGCLVVYDFSPGREIRGSDRLENWFAEFQRRYPPPPARAIDPATLVTCGQGLRLDAYEPFAVGLRLSLDFYLAYVLTETAVAAAIAAGTPRDEIRQWCRDGLEAIFAVPREVLFRGYMAFIAVDARAS